MQHKILDEETFIINATTTPNEMAALREHQQNFTISIRSQSNVEAIKAIPCDNEFLGDITIDESLDAVQLDALSDNALESVVLLVRDAILQKNYDYERMNAYFQKRQEMIRDKENLIPKQRKSEQPIPKITVSSSSPKRKMPRTKINPALLHAPSTSRVRKKIESEYVAPRKLEFK